MQELGVGVFVDLNVAPKYYKVNLIGVPAGYGAFCTRGYSDRLTQLEFEYQIAKSVAGDNELLFVIYGGGRMCREFAKQNGCIYVTPLVSIKHHINKIEEKANLADSVLFNDGEDLNNIATNAISQVKTNQIEYYNVKYKYKG